MTVITGIVRGVDIGRKIYQVYKRTDKRLQSISPANQFINRYSPPHLRPAIKKAYRYGEIALGGKLIYDLLNQGMTPDGKIQKQRPTTKYRKTRDNVFPSRGRPLSRYKYNSCYRRRRF